MRHHPLWPEAVLEVVVRALVPGLPAATHSAAPPRWCWRCPCSLLQVHC